MLNAVLFTALTAMGVVMLKKVNTWMCVWGKNRMGGMMGFLESTFWKHCNMIWLGHITWDIKQEGESERTIVYLHLHFPHVSLSMIITPIVPWWYRYHGAVGIINGLKNSLHITYLGIIFSLDNECSMMMNWYVSQLSALSSLSLSRSTLCTGRPMLASRRPRQSSPQE